MLKEEEDKRYYESDEEVESLKVGDVIQSRFLINQKIGEGSFGCVYKVIDKQNDNQTWAMKVELDEDDSSMLEREIKVLIELRKTQGFPQIRFYGQERGYTYCIMSMLGKNLEQLLRKLGGVMSLGTTLRLAIQMIERLQTLHDQRFLHRDIKPDNFVLDNSSNPRMLYLIDFGLTKHYINSKGDHIGYVKKAGLIGTARYASISAHEEMEQSRRDDLESVGYVLIYIATGFLPWMNLQIDTKDAKYAKILEIKKKIKNEDLCEKLPNCFLQFMNDVKSLEFQAKPNYKKLISYFEKEIESGSKQNFTYDWERLPEYSKQKKHLTVHVMQVTHYFIQTQEKKQHVEIKLHKQSQIQKQNQFINQNSKDSQQKSTQQQIATFEQIMNEKKKGTKKTVYSPTGKTKKTIKTPIMINIVEGKEVNNNSISISNDMSRIQNYSNTFLQTPQYNSQCILDSSILQPSVATSRINNYFESEGVVSEGGGLPIWDLGNGEKPEFQKVTKILEGIRKPSMIVQRKERKAHTQIDTVKNISELFVHPKKTIGDQESYLEGLEEN